MKTTREFFLCERVVAQTRLVSLHLSGVGEATATLHTLELLKNILSVLPQHSLKSCCEMILRVMTLSNVVGFQRALFT